MRIRILDPESFWPGIWDGKIRSRNTASSFLFLYFKYGIYLFFGLNVPSITGRTAV
jgi:hypothetical protein